MDGTLPPDFPEPIGHYGRRIRHTKPERTLALSGLVLLLMSLVLLGALYLKQDLPVFVVYLASSNSFFCGAIAIFTAFRKPQSSREKYNARLHSNNV
jgi:hypothetical protein